MPGEAQQSRRLATKTKSYGISRLPPNSGSLKESASFRESEYTAKRPPGSDEVVQGASVVSEWAKIWEQYRNGV